MWTVQADPGLFAGTGLQCFYIHLSNEWILKNPRKAS